MPSAIVRQWLVLSILPMPPRRLDAASIEAQLRARGHDVHRRTIQRDLVALSSVFPIVADQRSKPYAWRWRGPPRLLAGETGPVDAAWASLATAAPVRERTPPSAPANHPVEARLRIISAEVDEVLEALRPWGVRVDAETPPSDCSLVTCVLDDGPPLRRALVGFAAEVEVLAPLALRSEVIARLARAAARYGCGP